MDQIWPCRKICQGQPRIIIWTYLVVLDAAYQLSRSSFFWFQRRRFFNVFFTIYGHGSHLTLVMWPWLFEQNFSPYPRRLLINFGFIWPSGFRGDVWKCWRRTTYNIRRKIEACLSYKLTNEPLFQVSEKIRTVGRHEFLIFLNFLFWIRSFYHWPEIPHIHHKYLNQDIALSKRMIREEQGLQNKKDHFFSMLNRKC